MNFLTKTALKLSLKNLNLYSVGQKKSRKIPRQISHQIFSSSLMGALAKGFFLRKFCGKFAEICGKYVYCVRKGCGKFAEISRKFTEIFLQ